MARKYLSQRERFDVLTRCNYACFYCGTPAAMGLVQLQIEHVVPVSQGGTNEQWNLVAACADCNAGKGADAPHPDVIQAAVELYNSWPGRPGRVLVCTSCRRPWVPDPDDKEPMDTCWACVHAWVEGCWHGKQPGGEA